MEQIWTLLPKQGMVSLPVFSPAGWHGENNCVVGPFSDQTVAETFSSMKVDSATIDHAIFPKRDGWYVIIQLITETIQA